MTTYTYETNCGQYVLHVDGRPSSAPVDQISIAIDVGAGARLKIGDPTSVQKWVDKYRAKLKASGFGEMAEELKVITGRFTLEDLNRCLSTSGYAIAMYERLLKGELPQLPLFPPASSSSSAARAESTPQPAVRPAVSATATRRYPRPR
jgi:hypothetical protein